MKLLGPSSNFFSGDAIKAKHKFVSFIIYLFCSCFSENTGDLREKVPLYYCTISHLN